MNTPPDDPANPKPVEESELEGGTVLAQITEILRRADYFNDVPFRLEALVAQEYERGNQMMQSKFKEAVELADKQGYQAGLDAALAALPKAYQFKGSNAWKPEVGHGYGYGVAEALEQARGNIEMLQSSYAKEEDRPKKTD